jgi:arylsulfatase A-like enzyme
MELEGQEAIDHIRKCYAACVTRADKWLGKLLDKMDEYNMWEDTSIILTTDHGYLLGEHGYWAKNYMFDYNELVHIPLIIYHPGAAQNGKRISSLTSTIDLVPSLLDMHKAEPMEDIQGKSIMHLYTKDKEHHDWVLYGYFGKDVSMTDGRYTYIRQPVNDSCTDEYTANAFDYNRDTQAYHKAETGKFLKRRSLPIYKVKRKSWRHRNAPEHNLIYDILKDPYQQKLIIDDELEKKLENKMVELLKRYEAPEQQFVRLGLKI